MARKLILLAAVLAALVALAVPAIASAAPSLTQPAGTLVKPSTPITATSLKWTFTHSEFGLVCTEVIQKGEVATNSGSSVLFVPKVAGTTVGCMHNSHPVSPKEVSLKQFSMKEAGKGTASIVIKLELFEEPTTVCTWTSTTAPFTYVAGTNKIVFKAVPLKAEPGVCASGSLDAEYSLTLTNSPFSPVIID
jgi:hypothetical protein